LGLKKINLSGISPAKRSLYGPNSVYVDRSRGDNVQVILGAKLGFGQVPWSPSFFCVVIQRTFRQLRNGRFSPNLVTKRSSVFHRGIRKEIFETFYFKGHLPPKSEVKNRSNRHLPQNRLKRCTAERYWLLRIVVQGPGSFQGVATFLYDGRLRSYGASKFPNFRILAYFPYTKPLKRTFRWPAYSPWVTSQNDSDFSMW